MQYKIPLVLTPQPEGGYTVTSPLLPELLTEGETAEEALENVKDALAAVVEIYRDLGRSLPNDAQIVDLSVPLSFETVVTAPRSIATWRVNWRSLVARNCHGKAVVLIANGRIRRRGKRSLFPIGVVEI